MRTSIADCRDRKIVSCQAAIVLAASGSQVGVRAFLYRRAQRVARRNKRDKFTSGYLAMTKWPRRFCCQQDSLLCVQNGFSLP
jgi:hypothetical protein